MDVSGVKDGCLCWIPVHYRTMVALVSFGWGGRSQFYDIAKVVMIDMKI
jgi:hypothetical protein